jgi:hypothetical protein
MSEEPLRHSHFPFVSGNPDAEGFMATAAARKRRNGRNSTNVQARLNSWAAIYHRTRGLVSGVEGATSEQVQETVNDAIESASGAGERASDWSNENLDGVRQAVRMQPLALVRSL